MENPVSSGTNMTGDRRLSGMTRLHHFVISNSQISMITSRQLPTRWHQCSATGTSGGNAELDPSAGTGGSGS
ncbi:MAG: hypothetical protein ACLU9S_02160 [Oscillospiraceae bacterium]